MPKSTTRYWRNKLRLKDSIFMQRKAAILARLREKWAFRGQLTEEHRGDELKEWIRPLVQTWVMQDNKTSSVEDEVIDQKLEKYTSWAYRINSQSRDEKRRLYQKSEVPQAQTRVIGPQSAPSIELLPVTTEVSSATVTDFPEMKIEERTPGSSIDFPFYIADTPTAPSISTPGALTFDWDVVEVEIDATILKYGVVQLPAILLKPDAHRACSWEQFKFDTFHALFEKETGSRIDTSKYELVYRRGKGEQEYAFHRHGGYLNVLRRFTQAAQAIYLPNPILGLYVRLKSYNRAADPNVLLTHPSKSPIPPRATTLKYTALKVSNAEKGLKRMVKLPTYINGISFREDEETDDETDEDTDDYTDETYSPATDEG